MRDGTVSLYPRPHATVSHHQGGNLRRLVRSWTRREATQGLNTTYLHHQRILAVRSFGSRRESDCVWCLGKVGALARTRRQHGGDGWAGKAQGPHRDNAGGNERRNGIRHTRGHRSEYRTRGSRGCAADQGAWNVGSPFATRGESDDGERVRRRAKAARDTQHGGGGGGNGGWTDDARTHHTGGAAGSMGDVPVDGLMRRTATYLC